MQRLPMLVAAKIIHAFLFRKKHCNLENIKFEICILPSLIKTIFH